MNDKQKSQPVDLLLNIYSTKDDQPESDAVKNKFRSYWQYRLRAGEGTFCVSCEHWKPQTHRYNSEFGTCRLHGENTTGVKCHDFRGGQITEFDFVCPHFARRWERGMPHQSFDGKLAIVSSAGKTLVCSWSESRKCWIEHSPWLKIARTLGSDARWIEIHNLPKKAGHK